jgi:hypothetical protein
VQNNPTLTRSNIPKSNSIASVPTAVQHSKGGIAMPAVTVVQQKEGQLLPEPVSTEKLSFDGHTTAEKAGDRTNIQRFALDNSYSGKDHPEQGVSPFQLRSRTLNQPVTADIKKPFQTKKTIAAPIIQLAALAADKLNVVGEDHDESQPRRRKEFDLSVDKTKSNNFWLESMFKLDWSNVHQQDENKNNKGADPTLERVRYMLAKFNIMLESAFSKLKLVLPVEDDSSISLDDLIEQEDVSDLGEKHESTVVHGEELENFDLDEALKKDLSEAMLVLRATVADLYTQIDIAVTEELHKHLHHLDREDWPDTDIGPVNSIFALARELQVMATGAVQIHVPEKLSDVLTGIAHKGKAVYDHCQQANWISPHEKHQLINSPAKAMDDAKEYRSLVMHLAANKNNAVTGVWKVGEQHVLDIQGFMLREEASPIRYNLLSRSEFQEIYDAYYPSARSGDEYKKEVKQFVTASDHASPERIIQTEQTNRPAVVQRMYDGAESDIDLVLCIVLGTFENEARALEISKLSALDNVTDDELDAVTEAIRSGDQQGKALLKAGLEKGNDAFAEALLALIATPSQVETVTSSTTVSVDTSATDFEALIREALARHVPRVGGMIDAAQERALKSGKKLLVIVGEGHDDPYSRVMVTILVGAMQRLNVNRFYIESTPDLVRQHVEPYQHQTPKEDVPEMFAHKQHFYHSLYQQGATISGVDVDKETVRTSETDAKMEQPTSEEERIKRKAILADENVRRRNVGIAKTVVAHNESGVMLVGLSHLAGLAADKSIQSAYEIVAISTMLKEEAIGHNFMVYGRSLETTAGLSEMEHLYEGDSPGIPGEVTAKDAYAIAEKMVIEVNQQ